MLHKMAIVHTQSVEYHLDIVSQSKSDVTVLVSRPSVPPCYMAVVPYSNVVLCLFLSTDAALVWRFKVLPVSGGYNHVLIKVVFTRLLTVLNLLQHPLHEFVDCGLTAVGLHMLAVLVVVAAYQLVSVHAVRVSLLSAGVRFTVVLSST